MTSLKYKDENGFWQELQVGTNVVANPMLTGTEQELTSLQVGNTKYKSGGGKLYKHYITINGSNYYIYFLLYTHSDESIDSISKINSISGSILYGAFNGQYGNGAVSFFLRESSNDVIIYGCISPLVGNTQYVFVEGSNVYVVNNITDAVVEV